MSDAEQSENETKHNEKGWSESRKSVDEEKWGIKGKKLWRFVCKKLKKRDLKVKEEEFSK